MNITDDETLFLPLQSMRSSSTLPGSAWLFVPSPLLTELTNEYISVCSLKVEDDVVTGQRCPDTTITFDQGYSLLTLMRPIGTVHCRLPIADAATPGNLRAER